MFWKLGPWLIPQSLHRLRNDLECVEWDVMPYYSYTTPQSPCTDNGKHTAKCTFANEIPGNHTDHCQPFLGQLEVDPCCRDSFGRRRRASDRWKPSACKLSPSSRQFLYTESKTHATIHFCSSEAHLVKQPMYHYTALHTVVNYCSYRQETHQEMR